MVPLNLVAVGSPAAVARFPQDQVKAREVLTVVDDSGLVYEGDAAWIVCAWALPGLHGAANLLSSGARRTMFRGVLRVVDAVRQVGRTPYPRDDESVETQACVDENCPVGLPAAITLDAP